MQVSSTITNDEEALSSRLLEFVIEAIRPALKERIDELTAYVLGNFDDALIADLDSQRRIAGEFGLSPGRITQLIKEGKISTYGRLKLIRRSEVRLYLSTKQR